MKTNNFIITNLDTDSISFSKQDGSLFSKEEQYKLIEELNSQFDAEIKFAHDGYFPRFVVLRAKNYIMYDGKKIKIKGSALKSSTLEPKLKELINIFIEKLALDKADINYEDVYKDFIKQASNITDIKPWSKKMTLSEKTFNSVRENEQKVVRAIKGTDYKEGDKVYVYPKVSGELGLADNFNNDYNVDLYYEKLFKTVKRFSTVIDISNFLNYKLKKNKEKLNEIIY